MEGMSSCVGECEEQGEVGGGGGHDQAPHRLDSKWEMLARFSAYKGTGPGSR